MRIKWLITIVISLCIFQTNAQRSYLSLNDNWQFRFSHQVGKNSTQRISLPHTWNAPDALSGKLDYKRGIGNYEKDLYISPEWKGKRLFLYFEGVNSVADLFINGKYRGEHRGGYSAFTFEITDDVEYGTDNKILVRVNNAEQFDIMPLVGDFNFYGGIYRDVSLIITEPTCISLLDYASPGVYLTQKSVTEKQAHIVATVKLSNAATTKQVNVKVTVKDHDKTIQEIKRHVTLNAHSEGEAIIPFTIQNPRLWNGREDPFMYRAEISLWENDKLLDKVIQPLGIRYYRVDPDNGFFLNGKHLPLYGVCRHQDRAEIGNADARNGSQRRSVSPLPTSRIHVRPNGSIGYNHMGRNPIHRPRRICRQRIYRLRGFQEKRRRTIERTNPPKLQSPLDLFLGIIQRIDRTRR